MPGAEPSRSTHRDPGKQKGSSKTGKSNFREAFTNLFAVGVEFGPNGTLQSVNRKARGRRGQPREATASLASDRSNGSRGATRSVNDGDGFVEGVHAAGVHPGNVHPNNMHPDSVHQDINGRRQPSGDTASVASGKSNKSTGTRRSVKNGSGPTRSVHPGPGSIDQNSGGTEQSSGDTASVASRESKKFTKTKHGADNGNGSTRSVHQDIDGRRRPSGDTASITSGKSNHSTGTQRNVDYGNGSAGGELPGSVHPDSGGGGKAGAEGLGEEEGHGRGEDHDGGEVGGGKDDGGTKVVGEGHAGQGAGTDENAGKNDAEQALAGNNDTEERDLSEHSEERRAIEDDHAGTGERAIVGMLQGSIPHMHPSYAYGHIPFI